VSSVNDIKIPDLRAFKLEIKQQQELDELLKMCHDHLETCDDDLVSRAYKLAFLLHGEDTRKSGEPFYLHPLEVAHIVVKEMSLDDVSVAAALLHDTVEDTHVTIEEIREEFGPVVAHLIDGMTKIAGVLKSRESKQAETFMKLVMSMAEDLRVVLIKFSDRLHNMRTLKHLPKESQIRKANETLELYAPLAHRFGLFRLKSELEDLSFKAIDSQGYRFISRKLRERKDSREKFIQEFMQPIRDQLYKVGFNFEIKGRPKSIYSIYRKMVDQQKPFEDIYDLFAIRIILDPPHGREDCWRVYSYITDTYTPIPERFRDFLSVPKTNGYQSLHTTVFSRAGAKVEIQIRTRQMDEIAEKGLAAHWKYKEGSDGSNTIDRFVQWVRGVLDNPRSDTAQEFLQDFALNLFADEIYIFTPKGKLMTLPKGATPIDFAFEVHSEVGERALAAKVNGKMVPLRQKLHSGDQVEIITGKQINLNPDWINDVVTHKARARIRQFINMKERKAIEDGREAWIKKAEKQKLEISDQDLVKVANKLKYPSINRLYYDIGVGAFDVLTLTKAVKDFLSKGRIEEEKAKLEKISDEAIQDLYYDNARTAGSMRGLLVNGELTDIKYSYSKCCNPIPGDDVVGFLSRNGDVKIHRTACNNVAYLIKNDNERMVEIGWPKGKSAQFIGAVRIIGEDRVGLVNDITALISQSMKTNMKSINVNSDEGMFEGTLIIYVEDISHLEKVIKRLQRIPGVKQAYRFE